MEEIEKGKSLKLEKTLRKIEEKNNKKSNSRLFEIIAFIFVLIVLILAFIYVVYINKNRTVASDDKNALIYPSVVFIDNVRGSTVAKNTKVELLSVFAYLGDNTFYYRGASYYDSGKKISSTSCLKISPLEGTLFKFYPVNEPIHYEITIYKDKSCSNKVRTYSSKKYKVGSTSNTGNSNNGSNSNIGSYLDDIFSKKPALTLIEPSKRTYSSPIKITIKYKHNQDKLMYYTFQNYNNGLPGYSQPCSKIKAGETKEFTLMVGPNENSNRKSIVKLYSDSKCSNLVDTKNTKIYHYKESSSNSNNNNNNSSNNNNNNSNGNSNNKASIVMSRFNTTSWSSGTYGNVSVQSTPSNATVSLTSSNPYVMRVTKTSNGWKITAVEEGKAVITASNSAGAVDKVEYSVFVKNKPTSAMLKKGVARKETINGTVVYAENGCNASIVQKYIDDIGKVPTSVNRAKQVYIMTSTSYPGSSSSVGRTPGPDAYKWVEVLCTKYYPFTIPHEFAHTLDFAYKVRKQSTYLSSKKDWVSMYNKYKNNSTMLRSYSYNNTMEFFADTYAYYFMKKNGTISQTNMFKNNFPNDLSTLLLKELENAKKY